MACVTPPQVGSRKGKLKVGWTEHRGTENTQRLGFFFFFGSEGMQVNETKFTDSKFAPRDIILDCGDTKKIKQKYATPTI